MPGKRWLVKTDPAVFAFDDLSDLRRVAWRGVTQPLSLGHLERMRRGDEVFVYHSGSRREIAGTARVVKGAYVESDGGVAVDLAAVNSLRRPVALAEIKALAKAVPALADWALVRIPRIHVAPVPAAVWHRILSLSRRPAS